MFSLPCQALKKISEITALSFSKITASALSCYGAFVGIFACKESSFEQRDRIIKEIPEKLIRGNFENLEESLKEIRALQPPFFQNEPLQRLLEHCIATNDVPNMRQLLERNCHNSSSILFENGSPFPTHFDKNFRSTEMLMLLKEYKLVNNYTVENFIQTLDLRNNETKALFHDLLENFTTEDISFWEKTACNLWRTDDVPQKEEKLTEIFTKKQFDVSCAHRFLLTHLDSKKFQPERDIPLFTILIQAIPNQDWDSGKEDYTLDEFIKQEIIPLENDCKANETKQHQLSVWEMFRLAVQEKCSEPLVKFAAKLS